MASRLLALALLVSFVCAPVSAALCGSCSLGACDMTRVEGSEPNPTEVSATTSPSAPVPSQHCERMARLAAESTSGVAPTSDSAPPAKPPCHALAAKPSDHPATPVPSEGPPCCTMTSSPPASAPALGVAAAPQTMPLADAGLALPSDAPSSASPPWARATAPDVSPRAAPTPLFTLHASLLI